MLFGYKLTDVRRPKVGVFRLAANSVRNSRLRRVPVPVRVSVSVLVVPIVVVPLPVTVFVIWREIA